MSGVFESIERYPVTYLPTGDRAMLMAWTVQPAPWTGIDLDICQAILCLEDGTPRLATLTEFKFDYRYNIESQSWLDVSVIPPEGPTGQELLDDDDTDQEPPDDGGTPVQGRVPEAGGTSPGDPVHEP